MPFAIKVVSAANGQPVPGSGMYVKSYDPDAFKGRGDVQFTPKVAEAKQFSTHGEAWDYWKQTSKNTRCELMVALIGL